MSKNVLIALLMVGMQLQAQPLRFVEFQINSDLLAPPIRLTKTGQKIFPPIGWHSQSNEMIASLQKTISSGFDTTVMDIPEVTAYFIGRDSTNFLIVSILGLSHDFSFLPPDFADYLSDDGTNKIRIDQYKIDSLKVRQYLVETPVSVNYKIFCLTSINTIQLDFVLAKENNRETIQSVESSIGSLKYVIGNSKTE